MVEEKTQALQDKAEELEKLTKLDHLTGLYNRRYFEELLNAEIDRYVRYQHSFALLLIDIDHFKSINDKHGHNVGDKVIVDIGQCIQSQIRKSDSCARWGGEEFVVLLLEVDKDRAVMLAEKICNLISVDNFTGVDKATVSIGVAIWSETDTVESFIHRADTALYAAKESGRNNVRFYSD